MIWNRRQGGSNPSVACRPSSSVNFACFQATWHWSYPHLDTVQIFTEAAPNCVHSFFKWSSIPGPSNRSWVSSAYCVVLFSVPCRRAYYSSSSSAFPCYVICPVQCWWWTQLAVFTGCIILSLFNLLCLVIMLNTSTHIYNIIITNTEIQIFTRVFLSVPQDNVDAFRWTLFSFLTFCPLPAHTD